MLIARITITWLTSFTKELTSLAVDESAIRVGLELRHLTEDDTVTFFGKLVRDETSTGIHSIGINTLLFSILLGSGENMVESMETFNEGGNYHVVKVELSHGIVRWLEG